MVVAWNHGRSLVVIFSWSCRATDVWCNDVCIKFDAKREPLLLHFAFYDWSMPIHRKLNAYTCVYRWRKNGRVFKTISQRIALCNIVKKRNTYHLDDKYKTKRFHSTQDQRKCLVSNHFHNGGWITKNITRKQIMSASFRSHHVVALNR